MGHSISIFFGNLSDALNGAFKPEKSKEYNEIWHEIMEPQNEKENLRKDFNTILKDTKKAQKKLEEEFHNG
ncbi:hypothetical protein VS868_03280 [Salinimicrobium sp. 3283s]|uniref:hypothetical protein n=1 Tax=Salinimicrobium sp. 3283s TaxID=3114359 RepID=UPI0031F03C95